MSRMIRFHKFGPADVLRCEEQPEPSPAAGEVQVRVQAIGLSWYDVLWRQNLAPSHARLPAGIGHEMAGVVTQVGEGVDDIAVGDRVASFPATASRPPARTSIRCTVMSSFCRARPSPATPNI